MAGQSKQTSRNRKIEPLNWAETANSPALKGMMSFLDITSEEVRSGHFKDVPQDLVERDETANAITADALDHVVTQKPAPRPPTIVEIRSKSLKAPVTKSRDVRSPEGQSTEGLDETLTGGESLTDSVRETLTGIDSPPDSDSHTGSVVTPVSVSPAGSRVVLGSVPSQNRKIRKCRLSQDGHSAGEEMLYRVLWEEGRPETANPLGSRVVRIGYAELANKARLHKANVRLNLASLAAKLAIEQSGDFNSRDMIAKAYRVLSYKEILERRRAAGLEFVIRQKNVVFVTESGDPIPLAGMPQKAKAKQKAPEDRVALDTNPLSESRTGTDSGTGSATLPIGDTHTGSVTHPGGEYEADLARVSEALNTYWTVDDVAAEQLLRACRKIRPDAEAEEIAFFVVEKLELTRANRTINNPVGLILATVPQSFSGHSFEIFRQRRQESLRLAKEEAARKAEEDKMMNEWMIKDAKKTLANPSSSEKQRQHADEVLALFSQTESER
jgi:hypothetical protein